MIEWKEIEPGSSYRISTEGVIKCGDRVVTKSMEVKAKLVAAVFIIGDTSGVANLEVGFKDKDSSNCHLDNLYIMPSSEEEQRQSIIHIEDIFKAIRTCETTKQVKKMLDEQDIYMSCRQIEKFKKEYDLSFACVNYEAFDKNLNLKEWAAEQGIPYETLRKRIQRGWPLEKALKMPVLSTKSIRIH